jgi:ribokinase
MTDRPPSVAVLGSINLDVVLRVTHFPLAGQTISARSMCREPGGKGANQAVAAARAGAAVQMIGAVGRDADGSSLLATLEKERIDCRDVSVVEGCATGIAFILVDDKGENQIVISGGANLTLQPSSPKSAGVYLAQLESPVEAVGSFFKARPRGSIGILNAAPFRPDSRHLFADCDIVVLNETELAAYCGEKDLAATADLTVTLARHLLTNDAQSIIVTLGSAGSMTISRESAFATPAFEVAIVDATAAGDCFCGYLAARLAEGWALPKAVAEAHRASALAVQRPGAIASIPFAADLAGLGDPPSPN